MLTLSNLQKDLLICSKASRMHSKFAHIINKIFLIVNEADIYKKILNVVSISPTLSCPYILCEA